MVETICRICGKISIDIRWDEFGCPTYTICDCCGAESGYQDCDLYSITSYRKNWIDGGSPWHVKKTKPIDWDLGEQLKMIPLQFRNE